MVLRRAMRPPQSIEHFDIKVSEFRANLNANFCEIDSARYVDRTEREVGIFTKVAFFKPTYLADFGGRHTPHLRLAIVRPQTRQAVYVV
jgi:hypothetical protein